MKKITALAAALLFSAASPAIAADAGDPMAAAPQTVPGVLSPKQKQFYGQVAAAIRGQRWAEARALLDGAENGPLHDFLRAELLVAPNSPKAEVADIMPILARAPNLPQAEQLGRLAAKRGATDIPALPYQTRLSWAGSAPRRVGADSVSDPFANGLASSIPERIKNDDPAGAEALLNAVIDKLSPEARAEWQQKVAWSYYIENDDTNALRLSLACTQNGGAWATQGAWTQGLAAWRLRDYRTALTAFDRVAREAPDSELRAAAYYWASRAAMAAGEPAAVQPRLRAAAANEETFYGLLAAETLGDGVVRQQTARPDRSAWRALEEQPNVRAAIALAEIGEEQYAGEALRHQARIGNASQHEQLIAIANALSLPETQLYLAHNTPQGRKLAASTRYPQPKWEPNGGWRVDPALVFAHTLQESRFQRAAVSGAGAMGLMQVRPGTARDLARWNGDASGPGDLKTPAVNMDFGQRYLEYLSRDGSTGGQLPKVIAAYNAGPAPIARWQTEVRDGGDPLLYIESIPYWETRGYVGIVLRNYWMYEAQQGKPSVSRAALAQGKWPRFPDSKDRVRLSYAPGLTNAD
ncbi:MULTISPECIES: lytic transglycosylase domain-containing protein [unclassified Sphingopyxis]|uniref:lytic transglycosylase domain-containing protein n=1 Tax=unclassified Sphingopyxis TaxID=2614943 RepID=UPI000736F3F5|nr:MULTISPECIES: lytic transglycosylase domain-containing protein [unclassified Sphingopyxis]KTE34905.1 lytic murein transglycosylase [Sphingopyxis sp. HIX]KTE82290.1 lytic murein transglycosylase [Sphingopyxis sp. HXXIV]